MDWTHTLIEGPCNHPWWLVWEGNIKTGKTTAINVCQDCRIPWSRAKELGWEPGELKLAEGEVMITSWRGKDGEIHTEVREGPE